MKRNRRPELRSARLGITMLEIREATIQDGILEYLRWRQIPADPTHSTRNHPEVKGMLDIMAALPPTGRMCLLEVKSEDGIVSAEQEAIMKKYHAAGVLVAVVRSVEDVQKAIDGGRK